MLSYSDITPGKCIVLEGEPYEVLASSTAKKNRQKPVNQTKLKNLISGKVTERAFHQSDTVGEADISTRTIKYLFTKPDRQTDEQEFWFCDPDNPRDRFTLHDTHIGGSRRYLKENALVDAMVFDDAIVGITLPIKIDLAVAEAPPAIRGNTSQGGTKAVTLETGAIVNAPLFVNEGDKIRINTETGAYVERIEKK